jgi:hypothetical protein
MFAAALRRRDRHELVGQLFRIIVAAPGSLTGKYPVGNTGGADVSAFHAGAITKSTAVSSEIPPVNSNTCMSGCAWMSIG